jgi:hypothetical protein
MGTEPHINAGQMKSMCAFGKKPETLVFLKFTQANCAFIIVYRPITSSIFESRERIDDRLLKPTSENRPFAWRSLLMKWVIIFMILSRSVSECIPLCAVFGYYGVVTHQQEGAGQDAYQGYNQRRKIGI